MDIEQALKNIAVFEKRNSDPEEFAKIPPQRIKFLKNKIAEFAERNFPGFSASASCSDPEEFGTLKQLISEKHSDLYSETSGGVKPFGLVVFEKVVGISRGDFPTEEEFESAFFRSSDGTSSEGAEIKTEYLERLEKFVQFWRKHFVETMKPKFLNPYWDVNRFFF